MSERDFVLFIDRGTGQVWRREFRFWDQLHRSEEEGPAVIEYFRDCGRVSEELYYWEGKMHREDGPAAIYYLEDGRVRYESYYRHGLLHRDPKEGPAAIERDERKPEIVTEETYSLYGKNYRRPEEGPYFIERHPTTGKVKKQLTLTPEQAGKMPQPPERFPRESTRQAPEPT